MNLHPIEWFNFYGVFADVFKGVRDYNMITDHECAISMPEDPGYNKATFKNNGHLVEVLRVNQYGFDKGSTITKFSLLCGVRFKHDQQLTISHITYDLMGIEIPYIRVKCDYFKIIPKEDRYTGNQVNIVGWKKEEIKQDHSKNLFAQIPKFDDFTILPDNKNYQPIVKNCYNLYSKFPHTEFDGEVTLNDIPNVHNLINHIFGGSDGRVNHVDLAYKYFKVLYEYPRQILPILCLVSKDRDTGKTTTLNFMDMIFGNNFTLVAPEDLTDKFNGDFAIKNIIAADETFIEKSHGVEKVKSLSTAKSIKVSEKFISKYSIPFFGKIILCTNKVKDFMRIENEEIRFWIRRIPVITGTKNTKIEDDLFKEIPKFLKYLSQLPTIDFTRSRMVFTAEEIRTEELYNVKEESRSGLYKEIEMFIQEFFDNNQLCDEFYASAIDIKEEWFSRDSKISAPYIRKVLQDEAGMRPEKSHEGRSLKYYKFGRDSEGSMSKDYKTGTPYKFIRSK